MRRQAPFWSNRRPGDTPMTATDVEAAIDGALRQCPEPEKAFVILDEQDRPVWFSDGKDIWYIPFLLRKAEKK